MDNVVTWVKVAGGFRIGFGALEVLVVAARSAGMLAMKDWPEMAAGMPEGMTAGMLAVGVAMNLLVGIAGIVAGVLLMGIAGRIRARTSFNACVLGLIVLGVLAPCDCGWLVSAPACVWAVVRLYGAQSEFGATSARGPG